MEAEMRKKEAIKVHKWIAEYPRLIRRVLNVEDSTTPEECIEIIEVLEEQSLEYLVPVLLYSVDFNGVMNKVIARVNAESVAKTWEATGTKEMMADIKNKIREEIKLKEVRDNEILKKN